MKEFIRDYVRYFKARKKYFFIPLFLIFIFFAVLAFMAQNSAVSPFIYTIF